MKTKYLINYLIVIFTFIFASHSKGQSLAVSLNSPYICFGSQLNLNATLTGTPTGVIANNCTFDFNNDGIVDRTITNSGPNYNTQHLYTTAGNYTIKVEVNLSNNSKVSQTISVVVYRLPIPAFTLNSQNVQCFKNNLLVLNNTSVKTDSRIFKAEINWGDSNSNIYNNPLTGQNYSHTYTKSGPFNVSMKATDSLGCSKDTTYQNIVTIRQKITPSFVVLGSPGCFCTPFMLQNNANSLPFSQLLSYTWSFGDGQTFTRKQPWNLPTDRYKYDTIWHTYCKNGTFLPALTIEDINGCKDTFRFTEEMTDNKPRNIVIGLDPRPFLSLTDTVLGLRRDSVCFDKEGLSTLTFVQTPNPEISVGNGEVLWNFGDPPSMQQNFNNNSWNPPHTFVRGLGAYNVNLLVWPLRPNPACRKDTTIVVEVLGPRARIEDPQNMITLTPIDQNQCNPLGNYYRIVNFVNTAQYYKSNHVFRRWDFGDDVAPQCTSYLVPKAGYPLPGGWVDATDQYNNSNGYWRQGGKVFAGKRLDCRYSSDTLPLHRYTSWDEIFRRYRFGHDFMPWNPNQYSKNPADTLPTANPRKILVHPADTVWWGKPVYLNPTTGIWSLTQGSGPAPYGLWPRIDTIKSFDANGQPSPQDLKPYNKFTLQNGAPDPVAGFWGNTKRGGYGFFPKGFVVDPITDAMEAKYTGINGVFYRHNYETMVDPSRTLYRYLFDKAVQKCISVTQFLQDSFNNVGNKKHLVVNDFTKLDALDCNDDDQVQLKLMRPDATGLGMRGKECPGSFFNPDQAGINFMLGAVDNALGQYPGISPDCGASWIRMNLDSMADRRDQTPCALDGFINYTGGTGPAPQAGGTFSTTPGGLTYPPFSLNPDYNQFFMPPNRWNAPGGTNFWYHYGTNTFPLEVSPISGVTFIPPANPTGDITIGLIVGTGDPNNPCISDTVWYHNFLNITDLDGRFYVDPVYAPITNIPTNGACKYYCKNDMINFVYLDSVQSFIHSSTIDWGDNSVTVDSFYYSPNKGLTNGYFVNGFRRVRYNYYFGVCGEKTIGDLIDSLPFPNGLPGANATTRYIDNYTMRIYNVTSNPNGSLNRIGRVVTNDSTIWEECGRNFRVADKDTIKQFYRTEVLDRAKMLLPVTHKYWSSTFEADCKRSGSTPRAVRHQLLSTKECKKQTVDNKLLVRGVIDSVMTRDAKGNFDDVFCKNEPVHFYDSIRYYRNDCSLSDPIFNPNFNPKTGVPYDDPFNSYHYDTINYWRDGSLDINEYYPNGDFIEKVKYYFGDGDSAMWTSPVHKYKQAGEYTVTMLSRDKNGCWDTAFCKVKVTGLNGRSRIGFSVNNPTQCLIGNQFILKDTSNSLAGSYIRSWTWNNNSSNQSNLNLSFSMSGAYPVKLKATFNDGCIDTSSMLLNVLPKPNAGSISGLTTGLSNQQTYDYTLTQQVNHNYNWKLTNGNIISGQGTNTLKVKWLNFGNGIVEGTIISANGCFDTTSLMVNINNSTMVSEFASQSYSIFPNPVSAEIIIESNKPLNESRFELMDVNGKVLINQTCNTPINRLNIDVKSLSPAMYFLRITSQGQSNTVKIVKQ